MEKLVSFSATLALFLVCCGAGAQQISGPGLKVLYTFPLTGEPGSPVSLSEATPVFSMVRQ